MDYAINKAMKAALTPHDVTSSTKPLENVGNVKVGKLTEQKIQSRPIFQHVTNLPHG